MCQCERIRRWFRKDGPSNADMVWLAVKGSEVFDFYQYEDFWADSKVVVTCKKCGADYCFG